MTTTQGAPAGPPGPADRPFIPTLSMDDYRPDPLAVNRALWGPAGRPAEGTQVCMIEPVVRGNYG
jgi:hypothetical protein